MSVNKRRWLPLVFGLLLLPAVVPAPDGQFSAEWLVGLALSWLELGLVLSIVVSVSKKAWFQRRSRSLGVALGLGLTLVTQLGITSFEWFYVPELLRFEGQPKPSFEQTLSASLLFGFMSFGLWVLAFWYPEQMLKETRRQHETQRLRALADAQERQARLAPHFLLNTLNTVAALVAGEPRQARKVLGALGDLLRVALLPEDDGEHRVRHELELVRSYANILQARYGEERLKINVEVDPEVMACRVPPLLLQPLVENAVQHGALRRPESSVIWVKAERSDAGQLLLRVQNDGQLEERPCPGGGVGVVARRIELIDGANFMLHSRGDCTEAIVQMPCTRA